MKLGIQEIGLGVSREEMFRKIAEAGFESIDYSLMNGYRDPMWQFADEELQEKMESERKLMGKYGLIVGQTHAPMDAYWENDESTKEARWHAQIQAVKACAYLGSKYIVIHPLTKPIRMNQEKYEQSKKINMEFFTFIKPYLEQYDVKVAIENLFAYDHISGCYCETACSTAERLIDYVDTMNSDRFVVCLDTGHARLVGLDPVKMIYQLGKKYLHVLHIHDNNFTEDEHLMPGMGRLDWHGIGKALYDIGFEGVFNYESNVPFEYFGSYRKGMAEKLLKVYAELGKAITDKGRYEKECQVLK